ncbi:Transmembrane and coiled-coil domain-containing protein 4 [Mactra antiquata]
MNDERFHKRFTDVGLYSLGGLCAVCLSDLFYDQCHLDFKKKVMEKILLDLGQPKQTSASLMAMLDGEMMKDSSVFVTAILEEECTKISRQPIIADLISLAICDGCYDARMRVLIKHVAWQLKVSWDVVEETETVMAETLEYSTYTASEEEAKEKDKKSRNRKIKRYALIGLATVGGGALIGLTGGLAAPLVAAGAGAVIGGAGAAALGSAAGVAIIGSLFGVAGAGLTGYKMKRRVGAVEEFSFEPLTLIGSRLDRHKTVKQLHVTIAVTGWINDQCQDFRVPWSALAESKEQYSLRWESKYLSQLGEAFDYLLQTGISMATTEALKYTILSGLITAIAWPAALIGASAMIDNPWHVCTRRASEAGKQLAEVLLAREQGNRPVTLIGFSLGSRVIFSCLEELTKRKGGEGLIEDIILLGAPVSGDPKYWKPLTKVVAGKIVNGYSRGDWLLKFLFRTASVTFKVAGLGPVQWTDRRMHNIDLSDVIDGHGDYNKYLDTIMKAVGVRTKDELKSFDNIVKIGENIPQSVSRESTPKSNVSTNENVPESKEPTNENESNKGSANKNASDSNVSANENISTTESTNEKVSDNKESTNEESTSQNCSDGNESVNENSSLCAATSNENSFTNKELTSLAGSDSFEPVTETSYVSFESTNKQGPSNEHALVDDRTDDDSKNGEKNDESLISETSTDDGNSGSEPIDKTSSSSCDKVTTDTLQENLTVNEPVVDNATADEKPEMIEENLIKDEKIASNKNDIGVDTREVSESRGKEPNSSDIVYESDKIDVEDINIEADNDNVPDEMNTECSNSNQDVAESPNDNLNLSDRKADTKHEMENEETDDKGAKCDNVTLKPSSD